MPRSSASTADQELVDYAAAHGQQVTAWQIERWRLRGLLPANLRRALGRGLGSTSLPAPGAPELVIWLAQHARPGRRPRDLALHALGVGLAIPEATVRAAFVEAINNVVLTLEEAMPGAEPVELAEAAARTVRPGSLVPARIRRIDEALAKSGIDWAAPAVATLDPGFGLDQEPTTSKDWIFAAVHMLLAGSSGIDMATLGSLARALAPAGAAAPLAGQVEYRWPDDADHVDDRLNSAEGLRAILPDGDLREYFRHLALTTPLHELRQTWLLAADTPTWAERLAAAVEQELAEHRHGPATQEWIFTALGTGRLLLANALRETQPRAMGTAVTTLGLLFIRDMVRKLRRLWPDGHFELLELAIAGPKFLSDFIRE